MEEESLMNMSILLQFAKFSKGFKIPDFDEFLQECIGVENLAFFGRLAYPNQFQIRLTDPEIRERLIRTGRTRINNRSCWMYPLNQQEIRGFVHWLPNSVTNDQLTEQLKLYGDVLFVESEERIVKDRRIESDPRYYGLLLPYGTSKEDLPHFLKIYGFLSLVVVRGRQPACFHCKEVGHRRVECPKYKAKLIGYCYRDPNTAPPRLKPRGRRHIQVETKITEETGRDDVSSSDEVLCLERKVSDEETIEPPLLSVSEDRELSTEEATSSTRKEVAESNILHESRTKSCLGSSAASVSATEIQAQGILETLKQKQRKTSEDLQQRLKSFEKDIDETFTRRKLSIRFGEQKRSTATGAIDSRLNLEQEISNKELEMKTEEIWAPEKTSTPVKIPGEDYDIGTSIKETKGDGIQPALPTAHQGIIETIETIGKKSGEIAKDVETDESTAVGLVSVSETESILIMLEKTKQTAAEILEGTFKELAEFAKSNEATETLSEDFAADTDKKLTKDDNQFAFQMLEQAKQTATEYFENTLKKLKEEITSLSFQMTDEQSDRDTRLTKDDIQFAFQMLEQAKETVGGTLQNTFSRLEKDIAKVTEPNEMTAEISSESMPPLKLAEDSRKSSAALELLQDVIDTVKNFNKEETEIVAGTEISEKQSSADISHEGTIQTECDPAATSTGIFKATEISKQSEASEKVTVTEKIVTESKGLELNVSKTAQEDIDKLQTNIRKIFASFLATDKGELLPETRTILEQVESKVNQVAEEMKSRLKIDIEGTFASFKADTF